LHASRHTARKHGLHRDANDCEIGERCGHFAAYKFVPKGSTSFAKNELLELDKRATDRPQPGIMGVVSRLATGDRLAVRIFEYRSIISRKAPLLASIRDLDQSTMQ
jgi:hypothetical protein